MASPFEPRLSAVLKRSATAFLRPLGFKKTRNTYLCLLEDVQWIVCVQRDRWNTKDTASFTLNVGIYCPRVFHLYYNVVPPVIPEDCDCVIRNRIGILSDFNLDVWWTFSESDDAELVDEAMASDINRRLQEDALPFLQRFRSQQDILAFLEGPTVFRKRFCMAMPPTVTFSYIAILNFLHGNMDKVAAALDEAERVARIPFAREQVLTLRKRLLTAMQVKCQGAGDQGAVLR
jgi:hypothetical protein